MQLGTNLSSWSNWLLAWARAYSNLPSIYQISVLDLEINVIVIDSILMYGMYNQKQIIQTNHAKTKNPDF